MAYASASLSESDLLRVEGSPEDQDRIRHFTTGDAGLVAYVERGLLGAEEGTFHRFVEYNTFRRDAEPIEEGWAAERYSPDRIEEHLCGHSMRRQTPQELAELPACDDDWHMTHDNGGRPFLVTIGRALEGHPSVSSASAAAARVDVTIYREPPDTFVSIVDRIPRGYTAHSQLVARYEHVARVFVPPPSPANIQECEEVIARQLAPATGGGSVDSDDDNVSDVADNDTEGVLGEMVSTAHLYGRTDPGWVVGNSILVHIGPDGDGERYCFIGESVYEFTAPDRITEFHSYVGNNDVPYPIAASESRIHFMINSADHVDRNLFPEDGELWDAYSWFYDREPHTSAAQNVCTVQERLW